MRRTAFALLAMPTLAVAQAPVSSASAERAADPLNRMICKTFTETGSLIATRKVCKTKRDWAKERSDLTLRDPVGSCAGPQGGASGGSSFCGLGQ